MINNETVISIFEELAIDIDVTSPSLEALAEVNSKYLRDLKLNVMGMLGSRNLSRKEAYLIALSVAVNEKHSILIIAFTELAKKEGTSAEELAETHACVSIMNTNNTLYRFRHYMEGNQYYNSTPAGLRMSVMMAPVMGKILFELISLVVSALNGCERCVIAHEHSVKELGVAEARIYDAIRLGAVIKGLCVSV